MKWFLNLKIGVKLTLAFLLLAGVVALIGIRGIQNMGRLSEHLQTTFHHHIEPMEAVSLAARAYQHHRLARMEAIQSIGTPAYEEFMGKVDADMKTIETSLVEFKKGGLTPVEEKQVTQLETDLDLVRTNTNTLRQMLEEESLPREARQEAGNAFMLSPDVRKTASRIRVTFDELLDGQGKDAEAARNDGETLYLRQRTLFIATVAGAIVFAIVVGLLLARIITTPLRAFGAAIEEVARGRLGTPVLDTDRRDELGDLARTLLESIESQRRVIAEIKQSSSMVASSADEISASAVQITKGAENQSSATDQTSSTMVEMASQIDHVAKSAQSLAANVDETSSSIQEMGASIEQVARNADNLLSSVDETSTTIEQMAASIRSVANKVKIVDEASKEAETIAESGAGELSQVINGIGASSKDIGKIVRIIEEIADQTNLLALNAAIEAARAGDAGKGFAVVAEEVKRLAERSMNSTREISAFVQSVQKDVGAAVDLSGSVLRSIRDSVTKSSSLVSEVYTAAQEQSNGAVQILKTAGNMQNVTRQLATAARQQATAAREIMSSVETMNRMTQQVANATSEQKNGGDMVVKAVEQIAEVAQQNVASTEQLSKATAGLAREAERMRSLSAQFVY